MAHLIMRQSTNRKKLTEKGRFRVITILVLLVWVGIWAAIIVNRQNILDWWKLHNYHAPAAVSALATEDTMTSYARRVFYVNSPAIDNEQTFSKPCRNNGGEQTIVLGCYHSNQDGIYLLNVSDPRLSGVEQVTAAHEMLHAAYDRLSSGERNKVDGWLEDYYKHDLKDPRIIQTMQAYERTEPTQLVDEMHSVFGTEVANLPQPLEQYYKKYFNNRATITNYAAQYQAAFTSRQAVITQDDSQLTTLKSQIDLLESDLNNRNTAINAEESNLSSLKSSGNISGYNAGVPGFNSMIDEYNSEVAQVKNMISSFNTLVSQRNQVALVEDQLVQDLSSSKVTAIPSSN